MKIIHKSYFLVGILIAAAAVNLYLLYQSDQATGNESFKVIQASNLKVNLEALDSLADSIAGGNVTSRPIFYDSVNNFNSSLYSLNVPTDLNNQYDSVTKSWKIYNTGAIQVYKSSENNTNALDAVQNILTKNWDLILGTNSIITEINVELVRDGSRDYVRHQVISNELHGLARDITQNALKIIIGQGENGTKGLVNDKNKFDVQIQNLYAATPQSNVDNALISEQLLKIPNENSKEIVEVEKIWEDSIKNEIKIIEDQSKENEKFNVALANLKIQKPILSNDFNTLIEKWHEHIQEESAIQRNIVQTLLVVDIAIFFLVIVVVRQSLNPLEIISKGMSRVKEGVYGEKINYKSKDEIGELVGAFNLMSETIKQKTEEAEATDIAKDEFLSMITHELKTPLVPIQGYVDILLGEHLGTLTEKQKERLTIIKSSSESLLRIISDLLDAQKLELGKLVVKKENHNIKDTIEKAVQSLQPRAIENKVTIKQNNLEKEIVLPYDPERILQVLTNLLKNGLDAVKPDTGLIEITVKDSQDEIMISVKDNGPGIPKEKQDDLFKKFYQVDTSLTREIGGSGLGLAICKGLIEEHGGRIFADSTPGGGSTFSFTLPKNNQA